MNLKFGENQLTYIVAHCYDSSVEVDVKIFMYHHEQRLVVSDIDGTITK